MGRPYHPKDANEYPQHLTLITWDRIPHFLSSEVVECLLEMLEKERRRLHIEVYAFVVMPDHLHILVGPSTMPTGEVVRWMKMASGHWLRELGLIEGRVWSRGYWDKVIRDTRQLAAAIRYLHANPRRRVSLGRWRPIVTLATGTTTGYGSRRLRSPPCPSGDLEIPVKRASW